MSFPCFMCNARPDVACKHRAADPEWIPPELRPDAGKMDMRQFNSGHRTKPR